MVRLKETWSPLVPLPLEMPEPTTSRVVAALVSAMALVISAVAAAPVTFAVLTGEALGDAAAVPDVALAAGGLLELPDEPQAAAPAASAAVRMTVDTVLPRMPTVNLVDAMSPPLTFEYPLVVDLYD
jgi:hypothetical protein